VEHLLLCVALLTGIALVSLELSSMQFPIVGFRRSRLFLGLICRLRVCFQVITEICDRKLNMSVGTKSVWCSRAYSDSCKSRAYKQGEEIYDDMNANWRLPKRSAEWSWIVRIYLDLSIQLRNRQGSVLRVQPTRCNFS